MPNQSEILQKIQDIASQRLDCRCETRDIGPDTLLFKGGLELDSFSIVELIAHLEVEFSFEFRESDFREEYFRTIAALGRLVNSHVNG